MLTDGMLDRVSVHVEPLGRCRVSTGWRLDLGASGRTTLHFVLAGEGAIVTGDGSSHELSGYVLAVVPPGVRHALQRGDDVHVVAAADAMVGSAQALDLVAGAEGDLGLTVVCGEVSAAREGALDIFTGLRGPVTLDFSGTPEMRGIFEQLLDEQQRHGLGGHAMVQALMTQCLVLVLRRIEEIDELGSTWLLGLVHPRLGQAVKAILDRPDAPHTVESLASCASMGRSLFAEEFTSVVGRTPMALVREARLRRAAHLLETSDLRIDVIARRVGFASRSHFSQAFRSLHGVTPGAFRTRQRGAG